MTTKDITSLRHLKDVSLIYVPLKRLCDGLSWSVSFRHRLVRCYDIPNWQVLFTYQGDVTTATQICLANGRTSCDLMIMSQHGTGRSNQSLKWVNFFCVLHSTLSRHIRWFILFKVPVSTLLQRLRASVSFTYQL